MDSSRNPRLTPNDPILDTKYRYEIPSAGGKFNVLADQIKEREVNVL